MIYNSSVEGVLFLISALVAVVSAAMVILQRNAVYSALYLVLTFCALAVMYLLLGAQFIAMVQVIVYAGAIMVLFLFVIMLLNLDRPLETQSKLKHQYTVGGVLCFVLLLEMIYLLIRGLPTAGTQQPIPANFGTVEEIAYELFRNFALAFEVTSVVLLVGMIGVIVLAKRRLEETKESSANGAKKASSQEVTRPTAKERALTGARRE